MVRTLSSCIFMIVIILIVGNIFTSCEERERSQVENLDYEIKHESDTDDRRALITRSLERAYFEGQQDAINGDIKIKKVKDSCWIWIESPWDSGDKPLYVPCTMANEAERDLEPYEIEF